MNYWIKVVTIKFVYYKNNRKKIWVLMELINKFFNALFPQDITCIVCGRDIAKLGAVDLCEKCNHKVQFNNKRRCARCGKNVWAGSKYCPTCKKGLRVFDKASAPLFYLPPISVLMRKFKYDNAHYLAKPFAKFLFNEYLLSPFEVDMVIPVPMYHTRKIERGYNHAELLAREFCKLTKLTLDTKNFVRIINTKQQAKMNKMQREENIANAFRVGNNQVVRGKNILLIDDIFTTGTTLDECAKTLKNAGANKVFALCLAHAPTRLYLYNKNNSLNMIKSFDKMSKIMYNTQSKVNKNSPMPIFKK